MRNLGSVKVLDMSGLYPCGKLRVSDCRKPTVVRQVLSSVTPAHIDCNSGMGADVSVRSNPGIVTDGNKTETRTILRQVNMDIVTSETLSRLMRHQNIPRAILFLPLIDIVLSSPIVQGVY